MCLVQTWHAVQTCLHTREPASLPSLADFDLGKAATLSWPAHSELHVARAHVRAHCGPALILMGLMRRDSRAGIGTSISPHFQDCLVKWA